VVLWVTLLTVMKVEFSIGLRIEVLSSVYFSSSNIVWLSNVNGDRGFDNISKGGDVNSESGLCDYQDEELNSDGNSASIGVTMKINI